MTIPVEYPKSWSDYKLIDSGNGQKFESFRGYKIIRPDPRVIWKPHLDNWQAGATFDRNSKDGRWLYKSPPPKDWQISYQNIKFKLKPTDFRHVGIFPEQAVNWDYLAKTISGQPLKVLNLFAYTGAASIAASSAGAKVTHVDSSKGIISWAKENAALSNLKEDAIRWIEDGAGKFVEREIRRDSKYDGVILDPPRFGHGTRGEVWKLQDDLPKLLLNVRDILSPNYRFVLLNLYTADLSTVAISQLFKDVFRRDFEFFELALKENESDRLLPTGTVCRSI